MWEYVAFVILLVPVIFLSERDLGFRNFKKGLLIGLLPLPAFLLVGFEVSCPAWVLNQLGIATAEEVFFRGYLMSFWGNIMTSFLFSAVHVIKEPSLGSALTFFPSLLFGFAYRLSGSLVSPIILHWFSNLALASAIKEFPDLYHLLQRDLTGS